LKEHDMYVKHEKVHFYIISTKINSAIINYVLINSLKVRAKNLTLKFIKES